MKSFFVVLLVLGAGLHSNLAAARNLSRLRADRIEIAYVPPKNPAHEEVLRLLKERRVLENLKQFEPAAAAVDASAEGRGMRWSGQRLV